MFEEDEDSISNLSIDWQPSPAERPGMLRQERRVQSQEYKEPSQDPGRLSVRDYSKIKDSTSDPIDIHVSRPYAASVVHSSQPTP